MFLVPAEDYRPSPPPAKRGRERSHPLAVTAANDPQSIIHTLSGLSCALSIAKQNYGVMHGLILILILIIY